MATTTTEDAVKRLRDSKPPATDATTYLTIIEMSLTPELLPALRDILDDVKLTSEIGWDLVEMLIAVPGSEGCLERVAHLGNPREVILKVLEVMEKGAVEAEEAKEAKEGEDGVGEKAEGGTDMAVPATQRFVTLCGMLAVLHNRLRVKAPSRFLHTTLDTVHHSYDGASPEATAAVIALVRSLSGQKRPPLPTRKSSTVIAQTSSFQAGDASRSAPDPEASEGGGQDAGESALVQRLLQAFVTCVLESFVNANALEWPARLLEFTYPEKIVSGRMTQMQAFKDVDDLQARDGLIGQLVSLAGDVGLAKLPSDSIREAFAASPICSDPLSGELLSDKPEAMGLATGGLATLVAYWMFATDLFDAQHSIPDFHIFPHHHALLQNFLGDNPQDQIGSNPGVVEGLLVMGIWLHTQSRLIAPAATPDFMAYHHLLTLLGVFHANPRVRQSAITLAGLVLHAAPEEERLSILEDLLENCMFASLQSCAVSWVKDEIIAARKSEEDKSGSGGKFATAEGLERLQYALFPDLTHLQDEEAQDTEALLEFWAQSWPFQLQVANFAVFVFGPRYRDMAPAGMAAAVEHRYVEPLLHMAGVLRDAGAKDKTLDGATGEQATGTLEILTDTLGRVALR
ncbi:hypothetical protein V2A60_008925 [Cordyceps javanica]|uniref:Yap-binding protein n=1 Tax=Cordyceps javanica TaxID=43265 RepID=A0A545UPN1_9HYPO|nr:yap-binding protein [Cordyceps javanica]TQW03155.1 yap-binding protein [Cordyceps javanica]